MGKRQQGAAGTHDEGLASNMDDVFAEGLDAEKDAEEGNEMEESTEEEMASDEERIHLSAASDSEGESEGEEGEKGEGEKEVRVWRYGVDRIEEGEELVMSQSAYDMYHRFTNEWPALSFDFVCPEGWDGQRRDLTGPQEVLIVAGSQAAEGKENALSVLRCGNLCRTWEAEEGGSDSDEEERPSKVEFGRRVLSAPSCINRVATCPRAQKLVASFCEDGAVRVYNVEKQVEWLMRGGAGAAEAESQPLVFESGKGDAEGFGLAWVSEGAVFATGDKTGRLRCFTPRPGGWETHFQVDAAHGDSVESVAWQWKSQNVLASGGVDGCVRLWDVRTNAGAPGAGKLLHQTAEHADVNVVQFCPTTDHALNHLLVGADDGSITIVDIRFPELPLFRNTKYHKEPICDLDWNLQDQTCFIAASYDDRCTIWDPSAEHDELDPQHASEFPPGLIFEHMGHTNVSAVKFHPTIPYLCVTSALDGFSIWRSEDLWDFTKQSILLSPP